MQTIEDLFRAFGGPANVGRAIGVSTEHAAAMKRRGSVPVDYWPYLLKAAEAKNLNISPEILIHIHTAEAAE